MQGDLTLMREGRYEGKEWQKLLETINAITKECNTNDKILNLSVEKNDPEFMKMFFKIDSRRFIAKGVVENDKPCVYVEQLDY